MVGWKYHYISTMPSSPFALDETKIIARLMMECDGRESVRAVVHDGNLLNIRSISNESKQFNYIFSRLDVTPEPIVSVILNGDVVDSRYANLISIMIYDDLFREFVFEVYSEKRLSSDPITDYDIMSFFEAKAIESETVAKWKYDTLYKLRRLYCRVLFEAGLLKRSAGVREICTPIISSSVLDMMESKGFRDYIGATVGSQ
ncbi:DUF1819 family protein [Methanomethylophilus alvi]|uniref:DUF1819 family protein n=1 Tax=Methanomethylophilus alvi TaxID=1291540 RepID=UPI0037DD52DF